MGDHNRNINEGTEETVGAKQIIYHPQYNPTVINYNIALIQLASSVKISQRVIPICLPSQDSDVPIGSKCYMTGERRQIDLMIKISVRKIYELDFCVKCPLLLFPIIFSSPCWIEIGAQLSRFPFCSGMLEMIRSVTVVLCCGILYPKKREKLIQSGHLKSKSIIYLSRWTLTRQSCKTVCR